MTHVRILVVIVSVLFLSQAAWALKSDRDKPLKINANHVVVNNKQGVSHYSGEVSITQGTLVIRADDVYVYLEKGKLHKIVINGKPASFEQQPDNKQARVKSRAEEMEFFSKNELLILKKNAEVLQGGNSFRGDHIEYDTYHSIVRANKDASSKTRVEAIIQPREEKKDEKDKPVKP